MQELSPEAKRRLTRFEQFVKADVSRRVTQAEGQIAKAIEAVPDVERHRLAHRELLSTLEPEDQPGTRPVNEWLQAAEAAATALRAGNQHQSEALPPPPLAPVEKWAAERKRDAVEHAALTSVEEQQHLDAALAELQAREELSRRLPDVLAHLGDVRRLDRLKRAKGKLGTSSLSNTMTKLSRRLIEANLQDALTRHLKALSFNGLEVVVRSKTVRGRAKVSLRFKTVDDVPLNSVLSQGEQRRLALAMFLAEMEVLAESNPVVLDDPVSSIDQEGRRHIARVLGELATRQQVIVFTHELSLVHELQRGAPQGLPIHLQHVCRHERSVGHVRPGVPWEGASAKKRRQLLQDMLGEVRKDHEQGDDERYRASAQDFCVMLRSAFERAVEEVILGGTVTRRDDTVHTRNLRDVWCTEEICVRRPRCRRLLAVGTRQADGRRDGTADAR
jgi:hypothetical protein